MVIEAESRLGELLTNTSKVPLQEPSKGKDSLKGSKPSLPSGLDKKQSHYAQDYLFLIYNLLEYCFNLIYNIHTYISIIGGFGGAFYIKIF